MEKVSLLEIIFNKDEQDQIDDSVRGKKFFSREFSGSVTKELKRIQSKRLFRVISAFSRLLSQISTRVYGSALLTFGVVGALMYFLRFASDMTLLTPALGVVFTFISAPLLLADKPLPAFLSDFPLTDYIFYDIFCMKKHTTVTLVPFPIPAAVFIGFGLAVISAFIPFWQIALIIGILVCIYVGFESPEFVFLASLLVLPFLRFIPYGEVWLVCVALLAFASFIVKVLYGKRVIYIEQYDIFLGIMLLCLLISGIFLKGEASFSGSVRLIILSIGYLLAGNIVTNRRLAERSVNAVVVSGVITALVSLTQLIVIAIYRADSLSIADLSVVLARQDGVAMFLVAAILLAAGMIGQTSGVSRGAYICSVLFLASSLVISGEIFAVLVVILGIPAYYIIKNKTYPGILLPIMLLLPLAVLLAPNNILIDIFEYSPSVVSEESLFTLWDNSLKVISNNLFVGIGIGSESFAEEMANLGIFGYPDSSNLFIELGLEAGIFALISFFCVILTRMKHRSIQYLYVRNSQIEHLSCISGACMFSLLAFGMVNYIWSEPSAYYFFWCLFGIGSATLRVAKKDYDDKVVYYEESSAFDSSVIDIEIG